jgi:hypothetical protein
MDLRRLRAGEWIAALSGLMLLASTFLPWYAVEPPASGNLTAWEALAVIDIVLGIVAALAVLLWIVTANQRVPAMSIALAAFVTFAGILAVVLVASRIAALPDGTDGREWGLWLALLAALGIVVGGGLAMADERLSPPGRHTDATGRPVPPPGDMETIPAPRP